MKINGTRPCPSGFATCKQSEPGGPGSKTTWWALFHICILVPRPSHHPVFGDSPILLCAIDPGCTWVHALPLPSYVLLIQAVHGYTLFPSPPLLCTNDPGCTWVHALSLCTGVCKNKRACYILFREWRQCLRVGRQRVGEVPNPKNAFSTHFFLFWTGSSTIFASWMFETPKLSGWSKSKPVLSSQVTSRWSNSFIVSQVFLVFSPTTVFPQWLLLPTYPAPFDNSIQYLFLLPL